MGKIRVVVAAQSARVRRLITEGLARDADIEVAGAASSGAIALRKVDEVAPDTVVLDLDLTAPSGQETLTAIRGGHPQVRVIVFGEHTMRGEAATVDALLAGASDYVSCLSRTDGGDSTGASIEALGAKIKALGSASPGRKHAPRPAWTTANGPLRRVDVVAIGASTGGPDALEALLRQLPAKLPVPVVIVQHMPLLFTGFLVDRLAITSAIPIEEGKLGQSLAPGHAYLAPADHHMEVHPHGEGARISLHQGPPKNSCRPSVDVMLLSLAQTFGAHVLATILTGMGQDGLEGCQRVAAQGGQVLAQDESSSVVWGMPRAVILAGLARRVLPPAALAEEIESAVRMDRYAY